MSHLVETHTPDVLYLHVQKVPPKTGTISAYDSYFNQKMLNLE